MSLEDTCLEFLLKSWDIFKLVEKSKELKPFLYCCVDEFLTRCWESFFYYVNVQIVSTHANLITFTIAVCFTKIWPPLAVN